MKFNKIRKWWSAYEENFNFTEMISQTKELKFYPPYTTKKVLYTIRYRKQYRQRH